MLGRRNRTTLTLRTAALALVVLQVGASVLFPALDTSLEAESFSAPVHVESPANEDCAAHHDHLFCQVVRSLSSFSGVSPAVVERDRALPTVQLHLVDRSADEAPWGWHAGLMIAIEMHSQTVMPAMPRGS